MSRPYHPIQYWIGYVLRVTSAGPIVIEDPQS